MGSVPQTLWSRDDDTPAEREKKRKKIRSMKRQHRSLRLDVESKNRANSWHNFKAKAFKKRKKKMCDRRKDHSKSIFAHSEATDTMTHFQQRTHFHDLKKDPKQNSNKYAR